MQNLTQNLTKKEMDRAIVVFQARLKSEYKLFVKTKTWSHTQVENAHMMLCNICLYALM